MRKGTLKCLATAGYAYVEMLDSVHQQEVD